MLHVKARRTAKFCRSSAASIAAREKKFRAKTDVSLIPPSVNSFFLTVVTVIRNSK